MKDHMTTAAPHTLVGVSMSNETTDHAARIAEIEARLDAATPFNNTRMHRSGESEFCVDDCTDDMRPIAVFKGPNAEADCKQPYYAGRDHSYLLARVRELETGLKQAAAEMDRRCLLQMEVDQSYWKPQVEAALARAERAEFDPLNICLDCGAVNQCHTVSTETPSGTEYDLECNECGGTEFTDSIVTAMQEVVLEREALRTERDAALAELARMGPERYQVMDPDGKWRDVEGHVWGLPCHVRRIRVMQQEGAGDAKPTHDNMGRRAEEL